MDKTINFQFEEETKGAVRYEEIDSSGASVQYAYATIGTIYIRKSAIPAGKIPQMLQITIKGE